MPSQTTVVASSDEIPKRTVARLTSNGLLAFQSKSARDLGLDKVGWEERQTNRHAGREKSQTEQEGKTIEAVDVLERQGLSHDNDDNDTQRSPTSVDGGLALQA